ncbi:MAG: 30S ribosomal protein S16, partial [Patescibacteria group bacterium]|nr:30S ribosomal protein S16 [Patescibacteria group bacterium]
RAAKAGGIVQLLGTYNPKSKALTLDETRVKEWIAKGAQLTDSIHNLLVHKGVIRGEKVNVLPKKTPQKNEAKIAEEAAAAEAAKAAAAAVEPVVEAPTEEEVTAEAEPAPTEESAPTAEAELVVEEVPVAGEETQTV